MAIRNNYNYQAVFYILHSVATLITAGIITFWSVLFNLKIEESQQKCIFKLIKMMRLR